MRTSDVITLYIPLLVANIFQSPGALTLTFPSWFTYPQPPPLVTLTSLGHAPCQQQSDLIFKAQIQQTIRFIQYAHLNAWNYHPKTWLRSRGWSLDGVTFHCSRNIWSQGGWLHWNIESLLLIFVLLSSGRKRNGKCGARSMIVALFKIALFRQLVKIAARNFSEVDSLQKSGNYQSVEIDIV